MENITFHGLDYHKLTRGVFQLCLWPLTAPGYLEGGVPCLSSALWCQYPHQSALYTSYLRNLCKTSSNSCIAAPLTGCPFWHDQDWNHWTKSGHWQIQNTNKYKIKTYNAPYVTRVIRRMCLPSLPHIPVYKSGRPTISTSYTWKQL